MELLVVAVLGSFGYLIKNQTNNHKKNKKNTIFDIPKPSGMNIYNNRYSEQVFEDEMDKANYAMKKATIDQTLYRNLPETTWEDRHYKKSDQLIQLEKDILNPHPHTTTRGSANTLTELINSNKVKSFDLQGDTNKKSTESFNSRRNRMFDPQFKEIAKTSTGCPIYKTTYKQGKNILVHGKDSHNNMEHFINKKQSQNMNPYATRTFLELNTGTKPLYKHKQETKRFFPLVKDPYAVGGLPSASNRESDRFIPSISRQNVLPFDQKKVGPGLNKKFGDASNIGFHDPYRPLGRGFYKDIDDIRVNPKTIYKGRISGENFYIPKGEKTQPVISRRSIDLSHTNFAPEIQKNETTGKKLMSVTNLPENYNVQHNRGNEDINDVSKNIKEGFTNNFDSFIPQLYYRDNLCDIAEIQKGEVLDQDTIVLKETERDETGGNLCKYPSSNLAVNGKRNQTYLFDKAHETIKQQTEINKHSKINMNDEDRRNQTYFFDKGKETIKQQTEIHKHSKINMNDEDRRNQTYFFDNAQETIKEQTEDNIHSVINVNDESRRNQTYFFDKAYETIREQTEDNKHNKINPGAIGKFSLHNIFSFLNASINALKEAGIVFNRAPVKQGSKHTPDLEHQGKYNIFNRQQFYTYPYTKSFNPNVEAPAHSSKEFTGIQTQNFPHYEKDITTQDQRIDPVLVQGFKDCPYTQPLNSWQIPYNNAYPNKTIVDKRNVFLFKGG